MISFRRNTQNRQINKESRLWLPGIGGEGHQREAANKCMGFFLESWKFSRIKSGANSTTLVKPKKLDTLKD